MLIKNYFILSGLVAVLSSATGYSQTIQKVISLQVVNSDTNQIMQELKSGDKLNLAALPSRNFSIKAITYPSTVGSVLFSLDANVNFHIENTSPYTLLGDRSSGLPHPWKADLGSHSLRATPYSRYKLAGTKGESLSVSFEVIDQAVPKIDKLTLIDTKTNLSMGELVDGAVLDLAKLSSRSFSILAETIPQPVGSVIFKFDGETTQENYAPFSISGDTSGELNPWSPGLGEHSLIVTPFEGKSASGQSGIERRMSFKVIDSSLDTEIEPDPSTASCSPKAGERLVEVGTASELKSALSRSLPGDFIRLKDGTYTGAFAVYNRSGTSTSPITLCGSPNAILKVGSYYNSTGGAGYTGLRLDNSQFWVVKGFKITHAYIGMQIVNGAKNNIIDGLEVYNMGAVGINVRFNSQKNIIRNSYIHDIGKTVPDQGEGVYMGTSMQNWYKSPLNGSPDHSDDNQVLNNKFGPNVTAQGVDIKPGSSRTIVKGNVFNGSGTTHAGNVLDTKGDNSQITDNIVTAKLAAGFAIHLNDPYSFNNVFRRNKIDMQGYSGAYGIRNYSGTPGTVVGCDNTVVNGKLSNIPCQP